MENKESCPMCKISDDVIKNLAQDDKNNNKNNNNDSKKAGPAAIRGVGFFGKLKKIFK